MTQEELSKLTPEEKQLAIAEKCGWYDFGTTAPERGNLTPRIIGRNKLGMDRRFIPDYLNDLNACHEMEKMLSRSDQFAYAEFLRKLNPDEKAFSWQCPAQQRSDSFLLVVC